MSSVPGKKPEIDDRKLKRTHKCLVCSGSGEVLFSTDNIYQLRYIRWAANMSQRDMADALGISKGLIAQLETGRRRITPTTHALYVKFIQNLLSVDETEG